MTQWPKYGRIDGPIVMIGFGSIGRGTLPLIERHFDYDKERFVVIAPDDSDRALLDARGVKFVHLAITREMLATMRRGSVIVDIAIDQGGCCETSRPTTHSHPTYVVDGVVHYCVANMPGAVARTSTFALNNATLPFVLALADKGLRALSDDPHLRAGLNVHDGRLTCQPVAEAHRLDYTPAERALAG